MPSLVVKNFSGFLTSSDRIELVIFDLRMPCSIVSFNLFWVYLFEMYLKGLTLILGNLLPHINPIQPSPNTRCRHTQHPAIQLDFLIAPAFRPKDVLRPARWQCRTGRWRWSCWMPPGLQYVFPSPFVLHSASSFWKFRPSGSA